MQQHPEVTQSLPSILRISIEIVDFKYCFPLKKRPFQSKFAIRADFSNRDSNGTDIYTM